MEVIDSSRKLAQYGVEKSGLKVGQCKSEGGVFS